jgi:dihydroorotate dehydrogenase (NAD+) catalytic subunit
VSVASGDLSRTVFGRTFQNPLILAAGTAGFGRELVGVMDPDRLGGLVTKAVSLAPRAGNPAPRVAEFRGGMLNSVGLANPGLELVRDRLDGVPGIAAFELNLSCPNTNAGGIEFGADPECVRRIVAGCRVRTRLPLSAKLSPVLPDIPGMAVVARDAGADAISVVNTLPGLLFAESGATHRLGNGNGGVSGPVLLPVGVLAAARVVERTGGMPVIGVGGVRSADDVRQYLRVGASLVGIGTAALADPRLPERIIRDLERGDG